jgi:hypothetical protein
VSPSLDETGEYKVKNNDAINDPASDGCRLCGSSVLFFGGFGGLLRTLLPLLAELLESSELGTSQAAQDLRSFLLDSGVIAAGAKTAEYWSPVMQFSRWKCLCKLRIVTHLLETEKLGVKNSKSVASVSSLTISTWVRSELSTIIDGVAPVSSVSPMLKGALHSYVKVTNFIRVESQKVTYQLHRDSQRGSHGQQRTESWL